MTHSNSQPTLISIIMPLYNAERYVYTALQSILQEKHLPLEVIVVDDHSTDRSLREVKRIQDVRLRVLPNQGKGIAAAMNTGVAAAQGTYISRCDADDLYPRQRLLQQIEWLRQHPEVGAVCGGYNAINPAGKTVIQFECGKEIEEITEELQKGITRTHFCTFTVRTDLLRQVGGFRPYFVTAEDVDFQLRLGEISQVWYLPGLYYHYRVHDASVTHTKSSTEREFFDFIARELQQQRQTTGEDDVQRGCPPLPPKRHDKGRLTASRHIQGFLLGQAWREFGNGNQRQALVTGLRSAMTLPSNISVWRSLLAMSLKSLNKVPFSRKEQAFALERK